MCRLAPPEIEVALFTGLGELPLFNPDLEGDPPSSVSLFRAQVARSSLNRSVGQSTKLVVTQRVATIKDAEQIIVLDNGRVVGQGTHEELMEDCETYQEIALSQLSMEELQS